MITSPTHTQTDYLELHKDHAALQTKLRVGGGRSVGVGEGNGGGGGGGGGGRGGGGLNTSSSLLPSNSTIGAHHHHLHHSLPHHHHHYHHHTTTTTTTSPPDSDPSQQVPGRHAEYAKPANLGGPGSTIFPPLHTNHKCPNALVPPEPVKAKNVIT